MQKGQGDVQRTQVHGAHLAFRAAHDLQPASDDQSCAFWVFVVVVPSLIWQTFTLNGDRLGLKRQRGQRRA